VSGSMVLASGRVQPRQYPTGDRLLERLWSCVGETVNFFCMGQCQENALFMTTHLC